MHAVGRSKAGPLMRALESTMSCLVLDAMGVIFKSADDVAELLIPFILLPRKQGQLMRTSSSQHIWKQALEKLTQMNFGNR
jgi:hypothetical protein